MNTATTVCTTALARIFHRAGLTGGTAFFAGVTGLIVACGYDRGRVVAPGWASSSTGRIGWCCRGRTGGSTGSGGCEGGQAVVCGGEQIGPGGRVLDVQESPAAGAGQGRRDREEAMAQGFGFPPSGPVIGEREQAHPGEQIVRELHDQQPEPVLGEALQGQIRQAAVLGDPDTVLAAGPATVA